MRLRTLLPTALIAALVVLVMTGPAWAGVNDVPGPGGVGVLGLVALGVVGAIALSRWRK